MRMTTLTSRERQVLILAADGLTSREIGTRLGIGEGTVNVHLRHIYRKTGTAGRIEAVREVGLLVPRG